MPSICVRFLVYIPPINKKLGPTNMAPMASKTWVLKQWVARSSLFFLDQWVRRSNQLMILATMKRLTLGAGHLWVLMSP